MQQLVKYGSEFTNEGGAEVPVARLLNGSDFFEFVGYPQAGESGIDSQMISAAYTGLYSPIPGTFNTTATCTSGNCTWAPYYTLAICNTCVNLTSQIKSDTFDNHFGSKDMPFTTSTTQYTLPNGFRLSGLFQFDPESPLSTPILNLSATAHPADFNAPVEQGQPLSSIAFSQKGSVLLGVLAIGLSPFGVPTQPEESTDAHYPMALPVAYECLLQFCALNMTASQTNGTLQEQISSTYIDNSQNGTSYELSPCTGPNCAFQVTDQTLQATSSWLASFLAAGNASIEGQLLAVPNYDKPELGPVINAMNASVSGFPGLMDNVAASMTQTLRTLPYQGEGWIGSSHYPVTHIQVHWRWLIFPFALLLMSLTLLIVIATKTQQSGTAPWTNSVLAILFHGLDRQPRDQGSRRRMDLMENSAQGLMVEFQRDHGGGHLVLAEETVER